MISNNKRHNNKMSSIIPIIKYCIIINNKYENDNTNKYHNKYK